MDNQDSYLDYVKTLTASEIRIEIKEVADEYHQGDIDIKARCTQEVIALLDALDENGEKK
tara:strand:+ start:280 stop:459 length:180 start_codon:yes stop_codon:yes gene_type:complete